MSFWKPFVAAFAKAWNEMTAELGDGLGRALPPILFVLVIALVVLAILAVTGLIP